MATFFKVADVLVVLVVAYGCYLLKRRASRLPLPPGRKGLPLLGNALDIPKTFEWITYHKWSKELGTDILCLNVLGRKIIVLDTAEVASDLLEKRSNIYSSRPRFPMLVELVGSTFNTGTIKYGDHWRRHRRILHQYFGVSAPSNYKPHLVRAARNLLGKILDDPEPLTQHIRYMAGDAIMSVCYGLDVGTEGDSSYLPVVEKGVRSIIEAAVPGRFLVDALPILKFVPEWLPGAGFQKIARVWRQHTHDMVHLPFSAAKQKMTAGTCPPCFTCKVSRTLEVESDTKHENTASELDDLVRDTAATMYVAGSDTTAAALSSCLLGLLGRPDVLQRAREDLDRVVRPGSLPDLEDEPSLPFITAIVKETLRWRDVVPIAPVVGT